MSAFKFRKSLIKSWPGGRRNATVVQLNDKQSYPMWDRRVVALKAEWGEDGVRKPYTPPLPKVDSKGGMADVKQEDVPVATTTGPSQN